MTGWFGAKGPEPDWHKPAERRDASGPPISRSNGLHQFIRSAMLNLLGGRRDVKSSRRLFAWPECEGQLPPSRSVRCECSHLHTRPRGVSIAHASIPVAGCRGADGLRIPGARDATVADRAFAVSVLSNLVEEGSFSGRCFHARFQPRDELLSRIKFLCCQLLAHSRHILLRRRTSAVAGD